jgi:valyl-tRNA synthetase
VIRILDKRYVPKDVESKWHRTWADEGLFHFDLDSDKPVYSFDTPPPFTSGTLHMGHVFNHVWIDVVARYKRMRGFSVFLPQGFDCHGLPTELRVEKEMGVKKENREEFIRKCVEWTDSAVNRMRSQFERIGYSSDWRYSYRTMDDDYKATVQKTLLIFYERGLLYRGKHPVIWCPRCETALAKAEIGHLESEGKLYHIDLFSEGHKITIATTRPEMMPACVAVFVSPGDDRYEKFVGKKAKLPIFERDVPIIADAAVDPSFGTGVVYLCTFGDDQDIAWQRKYGLPVIEAIDEGGHMTNVAGKYAGLSAKDARKKIAEDLTEAGYLRKVEDIRHQVVSHTERGSCKSPIELLPLEQWFINVRDYTKDIIAAAREMNWFPEYMLQRLVDWCESMDWDWIISRQRVFGTPIPFWVCSCGAVIPASEDELPIDPRGTGRECPECGGQAVGEEDVCDCWVDSSITPLVVSKWGVDEVFHKKTYPVSLRPQGYEIIRTWAFYTIYRNLMLTGQGCFKELLVNGMVAGPDGRKMSKSLGNVIEPDEPLEKYSADTIRQWASLGALGADYPFSWEECEHSQKFLTKLWNVSRFIESHLEGFDAGGPKELSEPDRWILSRLQRMVGESTQNLDKFVFNIPLEQVRSFIWHDLADNYLEIVKHRLYKPEIYGKESRAAAQYTLKVVLDTCLRLLSPFTPHVCDEIWSQVMKDGYASTAPWPEVDAAYISEDAEESGVLLLEVVGWLRKYKSDLGMSLGADLENVEITASPQLKPVLEKLRTDIMGTGKIKNLTFSASDSERLRVVVH